MNRTLPPLQALRHFEVASRLGSFKDAAAELNVSQGAVSQQIRVLEHFLGTKLFDRLVRKVLLTAEGRRLSETCSRAFSEVSEVCREIRSNHDGRTIRIELGPFISARWLVPRLPSFISQHPDINAHLFHSIDVRSNEADVDISIQWGEGSWKSFDSAKLLDITLQPVGRPGLSMPEKPEWPSHLPPLLHSRSRLDWELWLTSAGLPAEWAQTGMVLNDANVVVEAAVTGTGIALGYFPLMDDEIKTGRLALLHPHRILAPKAYFVLTPPAVRSSRAVKVFMDWLGAESAIAKSS